MTKKNKIIVIISYLVFSAAIRILYYLFDFVGVMDNYGYFDGAFVCIEDHEYMLTSGLSFAYTNFLTHYINVFGSNLNQLFYLQLFLEILALLFLFLGAERFWGFKSAAVVGAFLSVSPVLIELCRICSPEEYFLFYFSIIFFVLSLFRQYSRAHHWTRCTRNEIIVFSMGFYCGVMICWNYMGLLLIVMLIIIMLRNFRIFSDKSELQERVDGEELEEERQIMSVPSQLILMIAGIIFGVFVTLLKYTGYTGMVIVEQFIWWKGLFSTLPAKTMDMETTVSLLMIFYIILGELFCLLFKLRVQRNENRRFDNSITNVDSEEDKNKNKKADNKEILQAFVKREGTKDGESTAFFITEDGRKVNYLENPLPIPKRPDKKDMRFDIDELIKEREYFSLDKESNNSTVSILESNNTSVMEKRNVIFINSGSFINLSEMDEDFINSASKNDFDHLIDSDDDFDV